MSDNEIKWTKTTQMPETGYFYVPYVPVNRPLTDEQLAEMYKEQGLDQDIYLPKIKHARECKERYYHVDHVCCPQCGSKRYSSTYIGYVISTENPEAFKDENDVQCLDCKWHGITHDLAKGMPLEKPSEEFKSPSHLKKYTKEALEEGKKYYDRIVISDKDTHCDSSENL
jgi:RNA polymerase subunit RPABC4/transcription elongation factor Spt4